MTDQLAFPAPPQPAQYGVVVDEVKLHAIGHRPFLDWWGSQAGRYERTGRARVLEAIVPGAIVEYGPFDHDDAEFFHEHLTEKGAHRKGLKVRRWTEQPHMPKCTKAVPCQLCTKAVAA